MSTFAETVEQLKNQYTDKYVKVDPSRPELARFRNAVGQVKTVNMNGRALVEFLNYHQNIGWHDIDLSCLTVVDPPPADVAAKAEPKRAHDKPAGKAAPTTGAKQVADAKSTAVAGEKKLSPLEMARLQGAGKADAAAPAAKPPAGEKKSTADILAAARNKAAAPAATPTPPKVTTTQPAEPTTAAPAKPPGGKMSTADILAAARSKAAATAAASTPATPPSPAPAPTPPAAEAAAEPAPAPAAAVPASPKASASGAAKLDKSTMTIDEMLAYCREKDAE